MEFFHKATNFPFMRTRRIWYVVSAIMMVVSLASLFTRGLNLSVDFTGGVTVQASFPTAADTEAVSRALRAAGYDEPSVTNFGTSRDVSIRLPPQPGQTSDVIRERMLAALKGVDQGIEIVQIENVGAQVGAELRNAGIQSLLATLLLIFIYVALRFHTWRLSVGALAAAAHDPIIVVGFFSLTGIPFDLATISALLAVIGYSLNDTVVVFDRIRERFHVARRLSPTEVLNQSINQTLSRTIITSGATLAVVVILLVLGGPVLLGFSTALVVGIMVGTYSSIYIASAVALDTGLVAEHLLPTSQKKPIDDLP